MITSSKKLLGNSKNDEEECVEISEESEKQSDFESENQIREEYLREVINETLRDRQIDFEIDERRNQEIEMNELLSRIRNILGRQLEKAADLQNETIISHIIGEQIRNIINSRIEELKSVDAFKRIDINDEKDDFEIKERIKKEYDFNVFLVRTKRFLNDETEQKMEQKKKDELIKELEKTRTLLWLSDGERLKILNQYLLRSNKEKTREDFERTKYIGDIKKDETKSSNRYYRTAYREKQSMLKNKTDELKNFDNNKAADDDDLQDKSLDI